MVRCVVLGVLAWAACLATVPSTMGASTHEPSNATAPAVTLTVANPPPSGAFQPGDKISAAFAFPAPPTHEGERDMDFIALMDGPRDVVDVAVVGALAASGGTVQVVAKRAGDLTLQYSRPPLAPLAQVSVRVDPPCERNCSRRGECVRGECQCGQGFAGKACDVLLQTLGVRLEAKAVGLHTDRRGEGFYVDGRVQVRVVGKDGNGIAMNGRDFVGLHRYGSMNGSTAVVWGVVREGEDTITLPAPAEPGDYVARLTQRDVYRVLTQSSPLAVHPWCAHNCSAKGVCVNGSCVCDVGYDLADCSRADGVVNVSVVRYSGEVHAGDQVKVRWWRNEWAAHIFSPRDWVGVFMLDDEDDNGDSDDCANAVAFAYAVPAPCDDPDEMEGRGTWVMGVASLEVPSAGNFVVRYVRADRRVFAASLPFTAFDHCPDANCSDHGDCRQGVCMCHPGWTTPDCHLSASPLDVALLTPSLPSQPSKPVNASAADIGVSKGAPVHVRVRVPLGLERGGAGSGNASTANEEGGREVDVLGVGERVSAYDYVALVRVGQELKDAARALRGRGAGEEPNTTKQREEELVSWEYANPRMVRRVDSALGVREGVLVLKARQEGLMQIRYVHAYSGKILARTPAFRVYPQCDGDCNSARGGGRCLYGKCECNDGWDPPLCDTANGAVKITTPLEVLLSSSAAHMSAFGARVVKSGGWFEDGDYLGLHLMRTDEDTPWHESEFVTAYELVSAAHDEEIVFPLHKRTTPGIYELRYTRGSGRVVATSDQFRVVPECGEGRYDLGQQACKCLPGKGGKLCDSDTCCFSLKVANSQSGSLSVSWKRPVNNGTDSDFVGVFRESDAALSYPMAWAYARHGPESAESGVAVLSFDAPLLKGEVCQVRYVRTQDYRPLATSDSFLC